MTPDDLGDKEREFLEGLRVDVIQANNMKERTRGQADCEEWMTKRKWRFTASYFPIGRETATSLWNTL